MNLLNKRHSANTISLSKCKHNLYFVIGSFEHLIKSMVLEEL